MELKLTRFSLRKFIVRNVFHSIIWKKNWFLLIFLWLKGFDSDSILLYNLNRKNYYSYLPDAIRYRISLNTNSGYWPILHDKLIFHNYVKEQLPTPELDFLIHTGKLFTVDANTENKNLEKDHEYVLKPLQGGEGQGIQFIKNENGVLSFMGKPFSQSELDSFISKCNFYGVFRYYRQHRILNDIFSGSTNTIRLVTLRDSSTNEPFIFNSLLRIGWSGSVPFDNYTQGGLVAQIDYKTGVLSKWKRKQVINGNIGVEEGTIHPDTKSKVEGVTIPHWEVIKSSILHFMEVNPFLDYIGWDILVTEDSFVVIEGNHNPGTYTVQLFKPYLSDPRAKAFFKSKKII